MKTQSILFAALRLCVLIITLSILTSCVTQRACNNKFPPQTRIDSFYIYKEITKFHDTTIYIKIPGDTIYLSDTVKIAEDGTTSSEHLKSELKYSYAEAWVENSKINLIHQTKDSIIALIIENAIRESTKTETSGKTETIIKEVTFIPWWAKILMFLSIPTILYIIFKIVKLILV